MSYRPQLRVVNRDGTMGEILADAKDIGYLDDDRDLGTVTFKYPRQGVNADLLVPLVEVALFVDGRELPNSRSRVDEFEGNLITEGSIQPMTWAGQTLLGRLDEALVLPASDQHAREDVLTPAEERALLKQKEEWLENQVSRRVREAKAKAAAYAESQAGPRGGNNTTGVDSGNVSGLRARALRFAAGQVSSPSQSWYRLCQSFVRQSYGFPGIYGSAIEAWNAGSKRTGTPFSDIPAGVPVYWSPNHVVLSAGGGQCYSNDICNAGDICLTTMAAVDAWTGTYLGWSTECSGRQVYP